MLQEQDATPGLQVLTPAQHNIATEITDSEESDGADDSAAKGKAEKRPTLTEAM